MGLPGLDNASSTNRSFPGPELEAARQVTPDQQEDLLKRILSSTLFRKSRRLSDFLSFVCLRYREGDLASIQEQRIGVEVFGRQTGYHVGEDSIVRSQARFLRQRLDEYFSDEGQKEPILLTIPKGSYIPSFNYRAIEESPVHELAADSASSSAPAGTASRWRWGLGGVATACLVAALLWAGFGLASTRNNQKNNGIEYKFWTGIFDPSREQMIVPGDSSLVAMEMISGKTVPLADYIDQSYISKLDPHKDNAVWHTISSSHNTTLADLDMVYSLQSIPGFQRSKVHVRAARDLSLNELKEGNAILIGGPLANPWTQLFENTSVFQLNYDYASQRNAVLNHRPLPGEIPLYIDEMVESHHIAYGVISFLPSLDGRGATLLIQGTRRAGTEAASDFLLSPGFDEVLKRVQRGAGFRHFSLLMRTGEMNGEAHHTQVVSLHLLD